MQQVDTLIEGGTILTMDAARRVVHDGSVAVRNGRIVGIGAVDDLRATYSADEKVDARHKIVMPGLVDLHGHAGFALMKGIGAHVPGAQWRSFGDFIGYRTSPEWWYLDSFLSSLERLRMGTTTSLYMLGAAPRGDDPEYAYSNARGVDAVGVRAVVGVGPSRPPWPQEYGTWKGGRRIERTVTFEQAFESTSEAIGTWNARPDSRVKLWVSVSRMLNENPADPIYNPDNARYVRPQAEGCRRLMEEHGVGFHLHAYGTAVKFMKENDFGLLGPKTVLAHGWPFDMETVEIMAETRTHVSHSPRSGRVYQYDGRLPIPELLEAGVVVGLGCDCCGRGWSANLWEDISLAPRLHRRLKEDERLLPDQTILEMATINGARALGMDDRIGSLEVGKDADIITVNLRTPHTVPSFAPVYSVGSFARGGDVDMVMVEGRVVLRDGEVTTVDEADIIDWADEELRTTVDLFGLEPLMRPSDHYWSHARD